MLNLSFNLQFQDLYTGDGLQKLNQAFGDFVPKGFHDLILEEKALHLEDFLEVLFNIQPQNQSLRGSHSDLDPIYHCKRQFVQRMALKTHGPGDYATPLKVWAEGEYAEQVLEWLQSPEENKDDLDQASLYAAWATYTEEGRGHHSDGVLFKIPAKQPHPIPVPCETHPLRETFSLTDPGATLEQALDQAHYCIICHPRGKDSCSKGLTQDKPGCPLDQKISEMNWLKARGYSIGALGVITLDNPMVALTGHRICNDCMKACIYQKQDPVDIPSLESRILKDVLSLPWGFEIYSLLTRWNPLKLGNTLPLPPSGKTVLVAGMGPSGITLSHYLVNLGHQVVAIDGLKLEPLKIPFKPIRDIHAYFEDLDTRSPQGFGGVAEYGITVRWNKNNLLLPRLILERSDLFSLHGGVRFGGTLTATQARKLGIDHIALCLGAGRPKPLPIPGNLAKGVRMASDFLMNLQLTGAFQEDSLANLQLRIPILVVGGGLTAMDTATEALAYYPRQVKRFKKRYDVLMAELGREAVGQSWTPEDHEVAEEFLTHAQMFESGTIPDTYTSTVVYRKTLGESPAYRLNPEEVALALSEGVRILDQTTPEGIETDHNGQAMGLRVTRLGQSETLPGKSILIATGTEPNTLLNRSDGEEGLYPLDPETGYFRESHPDITFFGDLNPQFAGNVVKAMASAKHGVGAIHQRLQELPPWKNKTDWSSLLSSRVVTVTELGPKIIEIVVHSPKAAENFKPGQFYRLQNFGIPTMEGLALTGADADPKTGTVTLVVLEMGGSSNLCRTLTPGDPIVLMGPTGTPTEIVSSETLCIVGGGLGNAVLFSIGREALAQQGKVLYFAAYKKSEDIFKKDLIEASATHVIWCVEEGGIPFPLRSQDRFFQGNVVEAISHYAHTPLSIPLGMVERLLVIGSAPMMEAVFKARHGVLKESLNPHHRAYGSINSPMQCMMKEICAQCLQRHIDPVTGAETIVFSCTNQDQPLDNVDWSCLKDRLAQNSLSEKIVRLWLELHK